MKVVLYDGDCPFCRGVSAWLARRPGVGRRDAREGHAEAARNEVLALDEANGEVRRGFEAIRWSFEGRWWARPLGWAPLRVPLSLLYALVARNRRLLFPPAPHPVRCACDPDPSPAARLALLPLLLAAPAATALLVARALDLPAGHALAAFALPLLPASPHAAVVLFCASLVVLPATAFAPALPFAGALALLLAVRMLVRRRGLAASPALFLAAGLAGCVGAVALLILGG